jgi:hypothetical protein
MRKRRKVRRGRARGGFSRWLDTFLSEKGIDLEDRFTVQGPEWGENDMAYEHVVDAIKRAPAHEQAGIKDMLVKIDFKNGDVRHYLRHLAQAIAR